MSTTSTNPGETGPSSLMVRLDRESKNALVQAAELRGISVSDYVRTITVAQARKEVAAAIVQTIALTADEQLAFWTALDSPVKLTARQKKLSKLIQGAS